MLRQFRGDLGFDLRPGRRWYRRTTTRRRRCSLASEADQTAPWRRACSRPSAARQRSRWRRSRPTALPCPARTPGDSDSRRFDRTAGTGTAGGSRRKTGFQCGPRRPPRECCQCRPRRTPAVPGTARTSRREHGESSWRPIIRGPYRLGGAGKQARPSGGRGNPASDPRRGTASSSHQTRLSLTPGVARVALKEMGSGPCAEKKPLFKVTSWLRSESHGGAGQRQWWQHT